MSSRMTEWEIPVNEVGIKPGRMPGLMGVVALFGPNGAGKSRLLRLLRDGLKDRHVVFTGVQERNTYPTKQPWDLTPSQRRVVRQTLCRQTADHPVREYWPTAIDNIVVEWVDTEHPRHLGSERRSLAVTRFEGLRALLRELTGLTIEAVDVEGTFCSGIGGRRLSPGALSEGQRELFLFAVRCFEQTDALRGCFFLIDEPETHLHPAALLRLVRVLRNTIGEEGQLWLATHSIELLSLLEREEIWVVMNGAVLPQGSRHVSEALAELAGHVEAVEALGRITQEPAAWAAVTFAAQCFDKPVPVSYRRGDVQLTQVLGALVEGGYDVASESGDAARRATIIDLGAGTGRLAWVLAEGNLASRFKYLAVEREEDAHAALSSSIEHLRQADATAASEGRIFFNLEELLSTGAKADFVVMTNVLHETEPADWCALFTAIDAVLVGNGSLVVVEDQQLPRGEFAHSSGFIVLGVQELRTLFAADDIDLVPCSNERYRGRLVGVRIRKRQLTGVSSTTTRRALECLRERCLREAKSMRQGQTDTSSGSEMRLGWQMAFLCVQAVNATHALQNFPDVEVRR